MSKLLDYAGLQYYHGKVEGEISQLRQEVTGAKKNYSSGWLTNTGAKDVSDSFIVTDFIPVAPGDTVVWYHGMTDAWRYYSVYDSNHALIGQNQRSSQSPSMTITISSDWTTAAYIRATMSATAETVYISVNGVVVWTKQDGYDGTQQEIDKLNYANDHLDAVVDYTNTGLYNGTQNNAGNTTLVRTERIAVTPGHTYILDVPRPLASGHYYTFGYATYSSLTGAINANQVRYKDIAATPWMLDPTITIEPGEVGLLFIIGERDENDSYVARRESDYIGYDIKFIDMTDLLETEQVMSKAKGLPEICDDNPNYTPGRYVTYNGTSYARTISTNADIGYVPIDLSLIKTNLKIYNFKFVPSTAAGSTYTKVIFFNSSNVLTKEWTSLNTEDAILIKSTDIPPESVSGYIDIPVSHAGEIKVAYNVDTVSYGNDNASQSRHILPQYNKAIYTLAGSARSEQPLVLLHFSDVHGGSENLQRIKAFYDNHSDYINDVLHTGDALSNDYSSDFTFWGTNGASGFLNVIGNHDTATYASGTGYDWTAHVGSDAYNRYFAPYISSWGVTQPANASTNGLCYYYKDYHDVRLIVLDDMSIMKTGDSAQLTWLSGVLDSARSGSKQVIIAAHYPNSLDAFSCPFQCIGGTATPNEGRSSVVSLVDSFISAGGVFVCWLTGHTHRDLIGTVASTTNKQVTIAISTAMYSGQAIFDNIARVAATPSMDLFNIFKVDPYNKRLSLFRIGSDFDSDGRHIGTVTVDYNNGILLNYW